MPRGIQERYGTGPRAPRNQGVRERIKAGNILTRVQKHALGELDPPMTASQLRAAEMLLKKVIPDLSAVQMVDSAGDMRTALDVQFVGNDEPAATKH